ncbi:insulinoma-associated protein 1a-like [Hippocampus zosterae]|uniref:insulinoma-associated protein 1a-like n=1 Tax=Hippocampus zosterae TaxID=109293 RepID=UPI00223E7ED1|nr:insulinoma-associated protein 1a-like [Hippocampus zosterae]
MPRGFLVKRSKRLNPLSYRRRCQDEAEERKPLGASSQELTSASTRSRWTAAPERQCGAARFGIPEGVYRALCSPTWPASAEREAERHPASGLASPASAEAFPAALAALGHLFDMGSGAADPECKVKAASKRVKNMRKLHFEDHVTTSPVLGLKIRAVPAAERRSPGGTDGRFVCQLCGEAYADPLGLAQHRCSRIVRVEYRCPECDKGFSCPANLASHRRWHKPKAQAKSLPAAGPGPSESASEGEEPGRRARGTERFNRQSCLWNHAAVRHTPIDLSAAASEDADGLRGRQVVGASASRF